MHDEVGAERQWPGQYRGRDGAVDSEQGADGVRDFGRPGDVGDRPQRVRRGLDPYEARPVRAHRITHRVERGRIDEIDRDPPRLGEILQPAAQSPIHDPGRHDMGISRKALENGGGGRHAGGEQQGRRAAFECGQQCLRLVVGRVVGASVAAASPVLVVGIAHERRRRVDRQDHGTGRRVGRAQRLRGKGGGMQRFAAHHVSAAAVRAWATAWIWSRRAGSVPKRR